MACGRTVLLVVSLALVSGGWAHADKLVVFQNGRTLRVQDVRDEGPWLYLTLGKKSEMGVLSRLIVAVNDIDGSGESPVPNVQSPAGGSGGGQGPAVNARTASTQRGRPANPRGASNQNVTDSPDAKQADAATRARGEALARAASRAASGRVGRVPPKNGEQQDTAVDPSSNLAGETPSNGWRSLLGDKSRGRTGARDSGRDNQKEEKPQ